MAYLHNIFELLSLLIAIFYYRYLKASFMKWFLPFLGFIFLGELYAKYQGYFLKESNYGIYCIIGVVESFFYGYIFYNLSKNRIFKSAIFFFVSISIVSYSVTYFFLGLDNSYLFLNFIISGFFLTGIALVYMYFKFIEDDKIILIFEPGFWIALWISLFNAGTSITFALHDVIKSNSLSLFGIKLYHFVPQILCFVLYSCISISIILCKKKTKVSY